MSTKPRAKKPAKHDEVPEPLAEKVCKVVLDGNIPPYRIVIRCPGGPDIVLLQIGEVAPGVAILHSDGSSNIRLR